ncbi:alpha/beta hydrolase [Psychrobacillus sp.]|uniref:alpha/beta hydrolase n=1 Tax=Psychrobacillus sp. TaxID=1871623 RepID=UPI0028BE5CEB|nr:alpha/beta hydrolase [Psychrobacillus sp.]
MKDEKKISITASNKEIQYTHMEKGSKVICFMFSGTGYTYDKPLFYYATMVMLKNNIDVVHVHYSYDENERNLPINEFSKLMVDDVDSVVRDVLEKGGYTETIFLGKSLGTIPIIAKYGLDANYSDSKVILLTPLLKMDAFFEGILGSINETFLVIGKNDVHYVQNKITKLKEKRNLKMKEINNANHSLDIEPYNTTVSIISLGEIMDSINDFTINKKG